MPLSVFVKCLCKEGEEGEGGDGEGEERKEKDRGGRGAERRRGGKGGRGGGEAKIREEVREERTEKDSVPVPGGVSAACFSAHS